MSLERQLLPDESITTVVTRLVDDTRGLAAAEIELAKARASAKVSSYKSAVIFFAIAGVLALAALIALLVGLIFVVATIWGPGAATAIVIGVTLLLALIFALIGKGRLNIPSAGGTQ